MEQIFTKARLEVLSELFTNFAAGWFGTIIIFPGLSGIKSSSDITYILIWNIFLGILSLLTAFKLKEQSYGF